MEKTCSPALLAVSPATAEPASAVGLFINAYDSDAIAGPPPPTPPAMANLDVTVANLTNAHALSPVALIAHQDGYSMLVIGSAATPGLEITAKGGANAQRRVEHIN